MDKHYLTGKPMPKIEEYAYAFEVPKETEAILDGNIYVEHDEFKWVSFEEALKMLKWEDNKEAFRRLNSS